MRIFLGCFCWLFFVVPVAVQAQANYYRSTIFHNITVNEGLAHRTAHVLEQDKNGYIWIGTNNGLNRYDGRSMETYRWDIQDDYSLPDNRLAAIHAAQDGRLWLISGHGKLSWFDGAGKRFHNLQLKDPATQQELYTYNLAEDHRGQIYILGRDQRIYRIEPGENTKLTPQLIPLPIIDSGSPSMARFLIDSQNRFWIQTNSGEVYCYDLSDSQLKFRKKYTLAGSLNFLNLDGEQLWLARNTQLYRIDLQNEYLDMEAVVDLKALVPALNSSIRQVLTDHKNRIWIGTSRNGLLQLEKREGQFVYRHFPGTTKKEGDISNNQVSRMLIDKYNVLWIGTQVGVSWTSLGQKPFYQINTDPEGTQSIVDNIIQSVYRDKFLWIGTRNGLSVIDTAENEIYNYIQFPNYQLGADYGGITALYKDRRGQMWMGTGTGNLYEIHHPEEPQRLTFTPLDRDHTGMDIVNINNILEDDLGRLWIGTTYRGIYLLDHQPGNSVYQIKHLGHLPDIMISNMYKDPYENVIWVGTSSHGLLQIRVDGTGQLQSNFYQSRPEDPNSLSLNHTNPIVKTDPHTLWVGTIGGGLNKLTFVGKDSVQYQWYTTHNGLVDNTIHTLLSDGEGHLWLGGTGLSRFDPKTEKFTHYGKEDGLQSNLFIVNSAFRDNYGRLYFGGPYGLNFFDPSRIRAEDNFPDIVLSGLRVLNESIAVGDKVNGRIILDQPLNQLSQLTIKEKENDLTLDLLALHFASPSKNRLQYRLLGHQNTWIDVPTMHATINYSNLQRGNYVLQVKASNGDGVWAPEIKELKITVLPYWYKTAWAYLAYGLLFIFLLYLFRRNVILQSNLRNNLKIAEIRLEKDQEVAEMKTRFFNNITHELRTPLTLIKGPVEELVGNDGISGDDQRNYYHIIHHNAQRLFNLVNRLLDFRKAESGHFKLEAASGNFVPFAREIFLSFQQLAREKQISYHFEGPDLLDLYFDREKMEIVLCNLLSNALKYSTAKDTVQVRIMAENENCLITVSDTGRGIPPEELDNIFNRFYQIARTESSQIIGTGIGLSMVKSIVELHRGKLEVDSEPGEGSAFRLRLPLGKAHLSEDQIVDAAPNEELIRDYPTAGTAGTTQTANPSATEPLLRKLLIVEDNPDIRRFINTIFREQFMIEEASDGQAGLDRLRQYRPDLIISDIMMEPMDGITFCTQLKSDPDLFHIPLILLTARTSNVYQVDGLSSGADAYITKPFNAEVLRAQVHSLLRSRAALRQYYTDRITLGPKKIDIPSEELLFLEALITAIESRLESEELTAENLAGIMAMSHSTLYRKVKSYTGESINSFIRSIRLKQAAQLLRDSDLNITQVAFKVGFSDVNYFGKCFKTQFKVSPSVYAKNKMNGDLKR